jgi:hypothetical protein
MVMTSFVIVVSAPEQRAHIRAMVFHGGGWEAERAVPRRSAKRTNMVALATIFAQLVAKATSISESAGESILARGKKYANYPRNLTDHSGSVLGMA